MKSKAVQVGKIYLSGFLFEHPFKKRKTKPLLLDKLEIKSNNRPNR
jgi:hypothetical protein